MVSDHYHDLSSALLWQYLKPDAENAEPVPVGGLINGRSIRDCADFPGRRCDTSTANVGLPSLDLEPGKNRRLRFINVGVLAEFQIQVDEHELMISEVEGTYIVPRSFHRITINPAQRYSVIINATRPEGDVFWLRARMVTECFTDPPATFEPEVRAIVRYGAPGGRASVNEPISIDWTEPLEKECRDMNTTELVPVEQISISGKPDAFFYLRSNFEIGKYRLSRGHFNKTSFRPNARSPSLHRFVDGIAAKSASFMFPAVTEAAGQKAFVNDAAFDVSNELVIQTTGIQTIDLIISNFDDGDHPFHAHGMWYFVLAQGHGYPPLTSVGAEISSETLAPLYDSLDLSNPLRRDTATVEAFERLLIRIVADNPGMWAFHCHVGWHSGAGLMMQLLTRSDELAIIEVPQAHRDLCAADRVERGMSPNNEDYKELAR